MGQCLFGYANGELKLADITRTAVRPPPYRHIPINKKPEYKKIDPNYSG
jgi:hypothetical protein